MHIAEARAACGGQRDHHRIDIAARASAFCNESLGADLDQLDAAFIGIVKSTLKRATRKVILPVQASETFDQIAHGYTLYTGR